MDRAAAVAQIGAIHFGPVNRDYDCDCGTDHREDIAKKIRNQGKPEE